MCPSARCRVDKRGGLDANCLDGAVASGAGKVVDLC